MVCIMHMEVYIAYTQNSAGRHCCLWCLIPASYLKVTLGAQGRYQAQNLESLKADHKRFLDAGGNVKRANNVIGEYFFDIPLEQVQYKKFQTPVDFMYMYNVCAYACNFYNVGVHSWSSSELRHL